MSDDKYLYDLLGPQFLLMNEPTRQRWRNSFAKAKATLVRDIEAEIYGTTEPLPTIDPSMLPKEE